MTNVPTIQAIIENYQRIRPWILETPLWAYQNYGADHPFGETQVHFKMELLQHAGSFKARGAITTLLNLPKEDLQKGIVAASAGNHGIAVSFAANAFGVSAKIVMPQIACPVRRARCRSFGAEVVPVETLADALTTMQQIAKQEQRTAIHPFEGHWIALGTGGIGWEIVQQLEEPCDAIIVPIGGGGLAGGLANAVKQLMPHCQIFGVEPMGADAMYRSFAAGKTVQLQKVNTIADSLAVPQTMPYSFALCRQYVDEIVRVSDEELAAAIKLLFYETKLGVEPAGAAATAALLGPLKQRLQGKKVVVMVSGTNFDWDRYQKLLIS